MNLGKTAASLLLVLGAATSVDAADESVPVSSADSDSLNAQTRRDTSSAADTGSGEREGGARVEDPVQAWRHWKQIDRAIALDELDGPDDILGKEEIIEDRIDDLTEEGARLQQSAAEWEARPRGRRRAAGGARRPGRDAAWRRSANAAAHRGCAREDQRGGTMARENRLLTQGSRARSSASAEAGCQIPTDRRGNPHPGGGTSMRERSCMRLRTGFALIATAVWMLGSDAARSESSESGGSEIRTPSGSHTGNRLKANVEAFLKYNSNLTLQKRDEKGAFISELTGRADLNRELSRGWSLEAQLSSVANLHQQHTEENWYFSRGRLGLRRAFRGGPDRHFQRIALLHRTGQRRVRLLSQCHAADLQAPAVEGLGSARRLREHNYTIPAEPEVRLHGARRLRRAANAMEPGLFQLLPDRQAEIQRRGLTRRRHQ